MIYYLLRDYHRFETGGGGGVLEFGGVEWESVQNKEKFTLEKDRTIPGQISRTCYRGGRGTSGLLGPHSVYISGACPGSICMQIPSHISHTGSLPLSLKQRKWPLDIDVYKSNNFVA